MKKLLSAFALLVLVALWAMPTQVSAQVLTVDTLDIAVTPVGNINTVINSDTIAGGLRAHPNRVYRLKRGSIYQVTQSMTVNGSLHIVARDSAGVRPPVLAPAILADNSSVGGYFSFIGKGATVDLANVYMLAIRADGAALGWADAMTFNADSIKLKMRGVIADGWSHTFIQLNGHWSKMDVQDCYFRNMAHPSSWFAGGAFLSGAPVHMDTCKWINNTFFVTNSYNWSIRGYDRFSVFDHNTMVYGTVNPFLTRQGSNIHYRNNLFYSVHAMGGNPEHVFGGWFLNTPDTTQSSILQIRPRITWGGITVGGPEAYIDAAHGVTAAMVDSTKRVTDVQNNVYFWPKKMTDFYKAWNDTVTKMDSVDLQSGGKQWLKRTIIPAGWDNILVRYVVDSLLKKWAPATTTVKNNTNVDPAFVADVQNHVDKQIAYVWKISADKLDSTWFYRNAVNGYAQYPPAWPIPENLAYTNASLQTAGTDGFALGDLNWFPTQKAAWKLTAVEPATPAAGVPQTYTLSQNYPNPFNPTTVIEFSIPKQSNVSLKVYNMLGQEVATLVNGSMTAGSHHAQFSAQNLASGVYFYRLTAGDFTSTKKMTLVK